MTNETDESKFPKREVWITKFCLSAGHIIKAVAWELGPTGRIKIADGDLRNLEFDRADWWENEAMARIHARNKQKAAIAAKENDLEQLRRLDFGAGEAAEAAE